MTELYSVPNPSPQACSRLETHTDFISIASGFVKYLRWNSRATFTSAIITGTSTSGPITAANAAPELIPNTETATAIASSKLFDAAVNESVVVFE